MDNSELYGVMSLADTFAVMSMALSQEGAGLSSDAIVATVKEYRARELSVDGLNDDRFGQRTTRVVKTNPSGPGVQTARDVVNVDHVPICQPKEAAPFEAVAPIVKDPSFSSTSRRDLNALEHGAAQDREDVYSSSVLAAIPNSVVDATDVPIQGLLARIIQAHHCAETGMTASAAPNVPGWDIRVASIADAQRMLQRYGDYTPLVIPHYMPDDAACALASLTLPGGAGAYGWRSHDPGPVDGGVDRSTLMPSAARLLYPGGRATTLALFEKPTGQYLFGGRALTKVALRKLVKWARMRFGNEYVDQAHKTMAAAGLVYIEPEPDPVDLGEGFEAKRVTTCRDGVDLARLDDVQQFPQPGDPAYRAVEGADPKPPPGMKDAIMTAIIFARQAGMGNGDGDGGTVLPGGRVLTRSELGLHDGVSRAWWREGNTHKKAEVDIDEILSQMIEPANGFDNEIVRFAQTTATRERSYTLYELIPSDQRAESDAELVRFRNSFGFDDAATLALPVFDLMRVVPLIAGLHTLAKIATAPTSVDDACVRTRLRGYVAKMHICHQFVFAERNIWPEDLNDMPFNHATHVAKLPKGLQPLAYVVDPQRQWLSAANWQLLDTAYRLKGASRKTAYIGFDVPGTWVVSNNGEVLINDSKTSVPALDAAVRSTWQNGGTINLDANRPVFAPIIDNHGNYAALGFAPVWRRGRRNRGTIVQAGLGADQIGSGVNNAFDSVMAY
ncbi:hypothetical protein CDD81_5918 [Ophiocordyceps australis]|uniref:Uncharacterized protein n=1 Tax=Ophiocordyceps australis TaxID=1399860 RepID=A0A2C5YGF2_9HYPO|nr:hypothetical protein CDD81_5918 [Ophiocordyceps australis]